MWDVHRHGCQINARCAVRQIQGEQDLFARLGVSGECDHEVAMRILILLIPMTVLLIGAAEADAPQQVMVQAVLTKTLVS